MPTNEVSKNINTTILLTNIDRFGNYYLGISKKTTWKKREGLFCFTFFFSCTLSSFLSHMAFALSFLYSSDLHPISWLMDIYSHSFFPFFVYFLNKSGLYNFYSSFKIRRTQSDWGIWSNKVEQQHSRKKSSNVRKIRNKIQNEELC